MEKELDINQPTESSEQPNQMERPPPSRPVKIIVHVPEIVIDMREGKDLYEGDGIIFSYISNVESSTD